MPAKTFTTWKQWQEYLKSKEPPAQLPQVSTNPDDYEVFGTQSRIKIDPEQIQKWIDEGKRKP